MSNHSVDSTDGDQQIWAVVPAAGIGKRMLSTIPKQYLSLNDESVLQVTLERLLAVPQVNGLVVALNKEDEYWKNVSLKSSKPVFIADGGDERCMSVINALKCLAQQKEFNEKNAWVLVHDAVRPCVSVTDIENLISQVGDNKSGGILAVPVRDTMKRQNEAQSVASTEDRDGLWHALTPQYFPYKTLLEALIQAENKGYSVTDDSSAMEQAGFSPKLVQGSDKNIKITRPEDLETAKHHILIEENQ